jgi:hypothetical protein
MLWLACLRARLLSLCMEPSTPTTDSDVDVANARMHRTHTTALGTHDGGMERDFLASRASQDFRNTFAVCRDKPTWAIAKASILLHRIDLS